MTHSTLHRHWRVKIIRKYPRCVICGTIKSREAHHLKDASHHPKDKYDPDNGVTLCRKHHVWLHTVFLDGFHEKCIEKDFNDFIELYGKIKFETIDMITNQIKEIR